MRSEDQQTDDIQTQRQSTGQITWRRLRPITPILEQMTPNMRNAAKRMDTQSSVRYRYQNIQGSHDKVRIPLYSASRQIHSLYQSTYEPFNIQQQEIEDLRKKKRT
ncbi:hypothetical protein pb186bvf_006741 [Paramecium bursaria]